MPGAATTVNGLDETIFDGTVANAQDNIEAFRTAALRNPTRKTGLSLGDRACLATALELNLPVITTDRVWSKLNLGIQIQVIR